MDLGVAVLAGLRGGHLHDLARTVLGNRHQGQNRRRALFISFKSGVAQGHWKSDLDHDEAALPEGGALHGEGLRGAGVALVEVGVIVMLGHPRDWAGSAKDGKPRIQGNIKAA